MLLPAPSNEETEAIVYEELADGWMAGTDSNVVGIVPSVVETRALVFAVVEGATGATGVVSTPGATGEDSTAGADDSGATGATGVDSAPGVAGVVSVPGATGEDSVAELIR